MSHTPWPDSEGGFGREPGAFSVACPECRQTLKLPTHLAGKRAKCPHCGIVFDTGARPAAPKPIQPALLIEPGVKPVPLREPLREPERPEPLRRDRPAPPPPARSRPPRRRNESASSMGLVLGILGTMFAIILVVTLVYWGLLTNQQEANDDGGLAFVPETELPRRQDPAPPRTNQPRGGPRGPAMLDGVQLDPAVLDKTKRATVYLIAEKGNERATGTGFLIQREGKTGLIVTNHHVIDFEPERGQGTPPGFGFPRPDFGLPRPGLPPGFGGRGLGPRPGGRARITAVFHSGTPDEIRYAAQIQSTTKEPDLAVLRIEGAAGLPEPLDVKAPQLSETQRIYFFGFPFGADLAVGNANPSVTIGQGTISALRRDRGGRLRVVQAECDINPGNSGGPAVNQKGELVGIAVAMVPDTNIGILIHPSELVAVLKPKLGLADVALDQKDGKIELVARAALIDLDDNVRDVLLLYRAGKELGELPARNDEGVWQRLADAQTLPLRRRGGEAEGRVALPGFTPGQTVVCQAAYVRANGTTQYTEAVAVRELGAAGEAPRRPADADRAERPNPARPPAPAPAPNPPLVGSAEENQPVPRLRIRLEPRTIGAVASPRGWPGLVGYWPFEEGDGAAAKDASGQGRDAKLSGHEWAKGVVGKCVELEGAQSGIDFGASKPLRFGAKEPFTFACWLKTTARDGTILGLRKMEDGRPVICLRLQTAGWLMADLRDDQGDDMRPAVECRGPIVADGQWRHLALVRLPSGNYELHVDGQLAGRGLHRPFGGGYLNTCLGSITTDQQTWGVDRHLTRHPSPINRTNFLAGKLDECCVFTRALTPAEIKKLAGAD